MVASDYIRAIGRHWLVIAICTLVGGGMGLSWAGTSPSIYQSNSAVMLTSNAGTTAAELVQGSNFTQNQIASYVLLATSPLVLEDAADRLGDKITAPTLARMVNASSPLNTTVIEIQAVSTSPEVSQKASSAVAESLIEAVDDVAPAGEDGRSTLNVTVIRPATLQTAPIAPNTRLYAIVGAGMGFLLALGYAVFRGLYWRTISRPSDFAAATSAPVLGEVLEARRGSTLIADIREDLVGPVAESVRAAAANLRFLGFERPLRSVVVGSASPAEGKTSFATALAYTLAESSLKVLLIDADLRRPTLGDVTQMESAVGLTGVLVGETTLSDAVQTWSGVDVLTSGSLPPNPAQLIDSKPMARLIEEATTAYDFVILDSAPLLLVADASWLGHMTDGIVLVARENKTHVRQFAKTVAGLDSASVPLLGVVLGRVRRRHRNRYDSYRPHPVTPVAAGTTKPDPAAVEAAEPDSTPTPTPGPTPGRRRATSGGGGAREGDPTEAEREDRGRQEVDDPEGPGRTSAHR